MLGCSVSTKYYAELQALTISHTWHIVHHGVPRLVEGNDVVKACSVVAGVVHVVHVIIAPGVQRVVVHRVEGGRGPSGAGHWGHGRT